MFIGISPHLTYILVLIFRETLWKILFFVENDLGLLNSEVDTGLTLAQIKEALATVTVSTSSGLTYDTFIFEGSMDMIFNFEYKFGLNFVSEVSTADFDSLKEVILNLWKAKKPGIHSHQCIWLNIYCKYCHDNFFVL